MRLAIGRITLLAALILTLRICYLSAKPVTPITQLDALIDRQLKNLSLPLSKLRKAESTSPKSQDFLAREFCQATAARKVLLVGHSSTFYLHLLWLAAVNAPQSPDACYGFGACTFHHICTPEDLGLALESSTAKPLTSIRHHPSQKDLIATNSSILRHILSTTLHEPSDDGELLSNQIVMDPTTGIRVKDTPWLAQARRMNIVILHRGPVPAPARTYEGPTGNWSFASDIYAERPHLVSDAVRSRISFASTTTEILNAAYDTTINSYLPEVIKTVKLIAQDSVLQARRVRIGWHSDWYMTPNCLKESATEETEIQELLLNSSDPWALYYNAQVYIQRRIMPPLLKQNNITFLDLGKPDSLHASSGKDWSLDCLFPRQASPLYLQLQSDLLQGLHMMKQQKSRA